MTEEDLRDQLFDLYGKYVRLYDLYFETAAKLSEIEWQYEQVARQTGLELIGGKHERL